MQEVIVVTSEEIPVETKAYVLANGFFLSIDWSKNFWNFINADWTKEESKPEDNYSALDCTELAYLSKL